MPLDKNIKTFFQQGNIQTAGYRKYGLYKVKNGVTTIEEVLRVTTVEKEIEE